MKGRMRIFTFILIISSQLFRTYALNESKLELKQRSIRPLILLNALDAAGLDGALWFIESVKLFSDSFSVGDIYVFHRPGDSIPADIMHINNLSRSSFIAYNATPPLEDHRIGKPVRDTEHVTKILSAWEYMSGVHDDETDNSRGMVISLSFLHGSIPVATSAFGKLIDIIAHNRGTDLFFLSKVKKLTSISDWHDISIAAFLRTSENFRKWMKSFKEIYMYYASNRVTFSMLEPRPAILEALATQERITVEYFTSKDDVCSATIPYELFFSQEAKNAVREHMAALKAGKVDHQLSEANPLLANHRKQFHTYHSHHHYEASRCRHLYFHHFRNISNEPLIPAIEFFCGTPSTKYPSSEVDACIVLELPMNWKYVDRRLPPSFSEVASRDPRRDHELKGSPTTLMAFGILRLRNATDEKTPRPFCWDIPYVSLLFT
jgi:hypothetical protein